MIRFGYVLRDALQNMRRNVFVAIGATVAVFVSLVLSFGALVGNEVVASNTGQWQEGEHIAVFLKDVPDGITSADHQSLQAEVEGWVEVAEVRYVDRAEAWEEYQELFKDSPSVLELSDPSVVPRSIRIKLKDIDSFQDIQFRLEGHPAVRRITVQGEVIERLSSFSKTLKRVAIGIAVIQGSAAVILIANTIRLAIYARRDEIAVMRLVGASNWFIQIPFLIEGLIEGLLGAALAVGTVWFSLRYAQDNFTLLEFLKIEVSPGFFARQGFFYLVFGAAAGFFGSALGVRRFMRV
jgi:cell division transport system permease protein